MAKKFVIFKKKSGNHKKLKESKGKFVKLKKMNENLVRIEKMMEKNCYNLKK